jgi:phosphatidylinositol 3-kinase
VPCPLDPSVQLMGIVPAECSVFKSALSPLRLAFRTSNGATSGQLQCVTHGMLR